LDYSDPYLVLQKKVKLSKNEVIYNNFKASFKKPLVVAVGKAAYKMAKFFLERIDPVRSLTILPKGSNVKLNSEIIESSHPQVTLSSLEAARRVKEILQEEDYDIFFFLLSGGASALMEDPLIPIEEYSQLNNDIVKSGLSINEINTIRKHLSSIKGGNLALYSKAPIVSFIVSDVPGNDLSSIGSGPTAPDFTTIEDAKESLIKVGLDKYVKYLKETPKDLKNVNNFIILDNMDVLLNLSKDTKNPFILTSEIRGEARSVGELIASVYNSSSLYSIPFSKNYTFIIGGEPDVTIRESERYGKGGRNSEVALSLLKWIRKGKFKFYAIATDGIDGNSEYAGCIIDDSLTINYKDIDEALRTHSSYELLEKYGVVVKTGLTYTNVNNVYLLIVP